MKKHFRVGAWLATLVVLLLSAATVLGAAAEKKSLYIVVLSQPSLSEKLVRETPGMSWRERRTVLQNQDSILYRKRVERSQADFLRAAPMALRRGGEPSAEPLEVTHRTTLLLNSILVRMTPGEARRMAGMTGVKGVYPNGRVEMAMDAVPQFLGAPEVWERLGGLEKAGAGMRIGIIDSGIDIEHPMFQDPTLEPPPTLPVPTGFAAYTNEKVIVSRNYVLHEYGLSEENTAADLVGHGSKVASIAAGAPVEAPLGALSGIAPRAFLGSYRVFGDPRTNPTATDGALVAAIEAAVADGMDVLNLSLGGPARDPNVDPNQMAIAQAVDLGVVVVVAAGNGGGAGAGSVMSPGTSPAAVTVGSVSHPRVFGLPLEIASTDPNLAVPDELVRFLQVPGLRTPTNQRFGPLPIVSVQSFDASGRACDPLPQGSLAGKLALVRRGICFFSVKAENVLDQAGAEGMVVYNDVGGEPFAMNLGEGTLSKPAIMIDLEHGEALRQLLLDATRAGVEVDAIIGSEDDEAPFPGEPDILQGFSGRGPSPSLEIKPDLVAPGEGIYTAAAGSNGASGATYTDPNFTSGTSFSTPMVSGAAALLRQLHPEWTAEQIKSALVNYASRTVRFNGRAALPTEAGAGRLDLSKAAAAEVVAQVHEAGSAQQSSVDLAFGILAEETGGERALVLDLANLGESPKDLTFSLENQAQVATISWRPTTLHLEPGATGSVTVSARLGRVSGDFEGFLKVRDTAGSTELAVPFLGVATVRGEGRTLRVSNSVGDFRSPTEALAAALPGDIIEVADDTEYPTPLVISRNAAGIKLDRLTIRAAPGSHPVINVLDSDTLSQPVIQVDGLERVTIEGLTILTRSLGIEYVDSSGTVRETRILMEDAEGTLPDAVRLENSSVHLYGNEIRGSNRDGVVLENSDTLAQGNTVSSSSRHGFVFTATAGSALFDNLIQGSQGDGVSSVESTLLAKGNSVLADATSGGDGIRAVGSSLSLRDNLISGGANVGVSLTAGSSASLFGDEISFARGAGLELDSSEASVESARFFFNGTAVEALSGRVDLRESLLVGSQAGPGLRMIEGELSIDHSTIVNNAGFGIVVDDLERLEVANSIFHGNSAGDLSGGVGGEFRFDLFQVSLPDGTGNQLGNPLFPGGTSAEDFAPGLGSPAIDAGDPVQGAVDSTDLLFHKRVVDGDGDGQARADMGAIEVGSPIAPPVALPILTERPGDFAGLAMVNAYTPALQSAAGAPSTSAVHLQAFDVAGRPQSGGGYSSQVQAGRQLALVLEDEAVLGQLPPGWVQIQSTQRDLMAFTLLGGDDLAFLDGAQLTSKPASRLLFPEVRGNDEDTWIYLINSRSDIGQDVVLLWKAPSGLVTEVSLQVPPSGMISKRFSELFGGGNGGYLVVEAEYPVFGLELFGDFNHRAGLLALDLDDVATDLFGAQLASTAQIGTTIHVINLGTGISPVVLTAYDENGAALVSTTRLLTSGGELRLSASDLFGFTGDVVGWLQVHSDQPVAGSVTFGDSEGRFLASLPLQSLGAREFFLSHVAQTDQIFTGITLLNTGDETALVSLEVINADGLPRGTAFLELKPGVKEARLLTELFGDSFVQAGGFIRVRSNQPVFGFELFGGRTLQYLSAVPPQVSVY